MLANALLHRLDGVQSRGPNNWLACCPAHADHSPSLAIKETDDGRLLLHCFAGCSTDSILSTVGLAFADLFPDAQGHHLPPVRKPWSAADVLHAVAFEVLVAVQFAKVMAQGRALSGEETARLLTCANRLNSALEVVHA